MSQLPSKRENRLTPEEHGSVESARAAGLHHTLDVGPGIRRKRAGKGFYYIGPDGTRITDAETLKRIRSLVIPPAWTGVWICSDARGHLQATGFDDRRRKQTATIRDGGTFATR